MYANILDALIALPTDIVTAPPPPPPRVLTLDDLHRTIEALQRPYRYDFGRLSRPYWWRFNALVAGPVRPRDAWSMIRGTGV